MPFFHSLPSYATTFIHHIGIFRNYPNLPHRRPDLPPVWYLGQVPDARYKETAWSRRRVAGVAVAFINGEALVMSMLLRRELDFDAYAAACLPLKSDVPNPDA